MTQAHRYKKPLRLQRFLFDPFAFDLRPSPRVFRRGGLHFFDADDAVLRVRARNGVGQKLRLSAAKHRNCRSLGPSSSGGVVVGSEMSADVRNILVENCDFAHNANCIRIKAKDGRGGVVENIDYKNLSLKKGSRGINLSFRYSCEATDDPLEPGKYLPTIRNIYCENIVCDSVSSGLTLENIPGAVMENLHFKNITMTAGVCMTADSVNGLYLENVNLTEQSDAGGAPRDSELAVIYGE